MSASAPSAAPAVTPWPRLIVVGVGLAAVVLVVLLAFIWPSVTSTVHGVRVVVAGPSAVTKPLEAQLTKKLGDTLDLKTVGSRAAAVTQIERREVYGAIVVGADPEVLTASAASPVVSGLLGTVATQLQTQLQAAADAQAQAAGAAAPTVTVKVTDVVPLASTDARGSGIAASSFPLVLGGMVGGVGIGMVVKGIARRLVAVTAYAIVGGAALAAVLEGFGVLHGNYLVDAAAAALSLAAIAGPVVGARALFGMPGLVVGPILFLLFANPISSAATPKEFLPGPWGEVGQWLPPGAAATLMRDLSYFPQADTLFPWLVLGGWTVLGYLLAALAHVRDRRAALR